MRTWMRAKISGDGIFSFFDNNNFTHAAIYGLGVDGKILYDELKNHSIKIDYCIDRNKNNIMINSPIYDLSDNLPDTEVIIVTPIIEFENIKAQLKQKTNAKIFSLEYVVNW